jgi:hypothetical protein
MHPTKTKIVYCKDGKRRGKHPNIKFDFLGYCFRPRLVRRSRDNSLFCSFNPAVSPSALKSMRAKIRELGIRRRTEVSLEEIAFRINPLLRGWINYYGRYAPSALAPLLRYVNQTLQAWARRKFKRFKVPDRGSVNPTPLGGMGLPHAPPWTSVRISTDWNSRNERPP